MATVFAVVRADPVTALPLGVAAWLRSSRPDVWEALRDDLDHVAQAKRAAEPGKTGAAGRQEVTSGEAP